MAASRSRSGSVRVGQMRKVRRIEAASVNCGGFEELDTCSSPFLVSAMQNGLCRPNRTNRGLLVNDDFEASPGFCVIGPLVGGNFTPKIRFWHVESAPRVRSLAKSLAASLLASLQPVALAPC